MKIEYTMEITEITETYNTRTPWLSLVISLNYLEIISLGALGLFSFGSGFSLLSIALAGILFYLTKELTNFTQTGKDGSIILYLIMGFGIGSVLGILFAIQLYGIAFNEPTVNLFKENAIINENEESTKVSI